MSSLETLTNLGTLGACVIIVKLFIDFIKSEGKANRETMNRVITSLDKNSQTLMRVCDKLGITNA